jgi:hypothetical protein
MTLSESTSSAGDTRASRSASLGPAEDMMTPDTSGPPSTTPFAFYDPAGRCWRTSQGTFLWDSEMSSVTWPRSGTTRSGRAYQRQPLVRLISGGGSSWLHTPTAKANQASPSMRSRDPGSWFRTPSATDYGTNQSPSPGAAVRPSLSTMARKGLWPTPNANRRGQSKNPGSRLRKTGTKQQSTLEDAVAEAGDRGALNPTWVEWLMGFPIGWTDLEPSATPSSPRSLS